MSKMWAASGVATPGVTVEVPKDAASHCAIPGMYPSLGTAGVTAPALPKGVSPTAGSFCFCKGTMEPHYCVSAHGVPEQVLPSLPPLPALCLHPFRSSPILLLLSSPSPSPRSSCSLTPLSPRPPRPLQINLQIASSTTIVAGFVTFETAMPADPPIAEFGRAAPPGSPSSSWQATPTQLKGVSHWYMEKSNATAPGQCGSGPCAAVGRNYTMSYVKFHGLEPGTNYTYRVKSGGNTAAWSDTFTFRAPVADGEPSKLGVYGWCFCLYSSSFCSSSCSSIITAPLLFFVLDLITTRRLILGSVQATWACMPGTTCRICKRTAKMAT